MDFSGNLNRLEVVKSYPKPRGRVKIVHHDLKAELNSEIQSSIGRIDYISHLAAGSHVTDLSHPLEFVMDNVVGTAHILDYAKQDSLEHFAYFSTDEVFGPAQKELILKKMIDIILQIHTQPPKPEVRN